LGVRHFSRKRMPHYQTTQGQFQRGMKHGNYNAWLTETGYSSYDVLMAIDPDHVPDPGFLAETLGQLADPRIAYVQSPQEYYNESASFIARGCGEESRDFYWISQRAYHRFRTPSVIGAHGVHRLQALQSVGGFAAHLADDLLLTLQYQMAGWRGAYVPKVLARGLAPVDWPTYVKQQRRWAMSLFDVKFRRYPHLARALPLRSRIVGFLQGLTYLQDGLAALCIATSVGAILIAGVPPALAQAMLSTPLLLGLAILIVTGLYPHRFHGPHRNLVFNWRAACLRMVKWPYTLLALGDVIKRRDRGYDLTAKADHPARIDWASVWPHVLLCVLVGALWIVGMTLGEERDSLAHGLAIVAVLPSLLLVGSAFLKAPAAFDPFLTQRVPEDHER
jgi:cellulose synthase/poly-beta-1,6-N-acetylglucosamine synthase-like glycosyltransferase